MFLTAYGSSWFSTNPGDLPVLNQFRLADSYNYVPSPGQTALQGGIQFSGTPSTPRLLPSGEIAYDIHLDLSVGDFSWGELGLYLNGNLFGLTAYSTLMRKSKLHGSEPGNAVSMTVIFHPSQVSGVVLLSNTDNELNVAKATSLDVLPPAQLAYPNIFTVTNPKSPNRTVLAVADATVWNVSGYETTAYQGPVTSATANSLRVVASLVGPFAPGDLLVHVVNGPAAGYTRIVEAWDSVNSTFLLRSPLPKNPLPGNTLLVSQRTQPGTSGSGGDLSTQVNTAVSAASGATASASAANAAAALASASAIQASDSSAQSSVSATAAAASAAVAVSASSSASSSSSSAFSSASSASAASSLAEASSISASSSASASAASAAAAATASAQTTTDYAYLRSRANHLGQQPASTILDLEQVVDARVELLRPEDASLPRLTSLLGTEDLVVITALGKQLVGLCVLAAFLGCPAVPSPPAAFASNQWSLTAILEGVRFNLLEAPGTGSSPITAFEYTLNDGLSWTAFQGTALGVYDVLGLPPTLVQGRVRAVNAVAPGLPSNLTTATPIAAEVPASTLSFDGNSLLFEGVPLVFQP